MPIIINILPSHESKSPMSVEPTLTISDLTKQLGEKYSVPVENIRLIHTGKILKDEDTLDSNKIVEGSTIHMVRVSGAKGIGTVPNGTTAIQTTTPTGDALINLTPTTFPNIENMMRNPLQVRQTMQQITSNPELYRTLITSEPGFDGLSPEEQEEMSQPEYLESIVEAFSNPRMYAMIVAEAHREFGGLPNSPSVSQAQVDRVNAVLTQAARTGSNPPRPVQPPASTEPPEVRFRLQLECLHDLGFRNREENIQALLETGGNVTNAIRLFFQRR